MELGLEEAQASKCSRAGKVRHAECPHLATAWPRTAPKLLLLLLLLPPVRPLSARRLPLRSAALVKCLPVLSLGSPFPLHIRGLSKAAERGASDDNASCSCRSWLPGATL